MALYQNINFSKGFFCINKYGDLKQFQIKRSDYVVHGKFSSKNISEDEIYEKAVNGFYYILNASGIV